ncbi:MAG: hypothetical protein F6J93_27700 [Oscillatoria sp. SIO1A7]|nr:hypothetical protein [Oscillatoria sp. SIO1A7]
MKTINFAGHEWKVTKESPHGNFVVAVLPEEAIAICITYSNKWGWEETEPNSPIKGLIVYLGCTEQSTNRWRRTAVAFGGYFDFHKQEEVPRKSKRQRLAPLELKIRGMSGQSLEKLIGIYSSSHQFFWVKYGAAISPMATFNCSLQVTGAVL